MSNSRKHPLSFLLWLLPMLYMALFFYAPLGAVLKEMTAGLLSKGLGRANAGELLLRVTGFTFYQAALSTLLTLALGLPAAYLFARLRFAGKRALHVVLTLPFILPTVVVAAGFGAFLGPSGWLNQALMGLLGTKTAPIVFSGTLGAILTAHVFYNTALVIRVVGAAWSQLDPRLTQAARVLGASPWQSFREVTFPLLRPAIFAAAALVFLFDFASFGVILLLGGPQFATLEVEVYLQAMQFYNLPLAAVLSMIQIAATLVLTLFYNRFQRGSGANIPLMPRFSDALTRPPKNGGERALLIGVLGLLSLLIVLPLLALVFKSVAFINQAGQLTLTFDFYRELFINRRDSLFFVPPFLAVRNSLLYGALTMLFSLSLGFLIAHALQLPSSERAFHRRRFNARAWFETAIMLPLGTSPLTLGLGFLLLFNRPPLDARSFPLFIPIAHSLVALPMVVRTLQPALRSIPRNVRDTAAVLGASPLRRWLEVDLPIVSRAAVVAGIFAFTISLGEFGASTFLSRPDMPTMPTAIFRFLSQPGALNYGASMAMSVLLLGLCALGIVLIERLQQ